MIEETVKQANERMNKAISVLRHEFAGIRTGRASATLLERVLVDCYGTKTPVNQVATINVPEPQLIVIQPWDRSIISQIEKAIQQSELGINPTSDGTVIRLPFPPLTEDRRKDIVKMIHKITEESRIAIRNIRRDLNEHLKAAEKKGEISENELERALEEIQKITDKFITEIDSVLAHKEKEVMEV